MSQALKEKVRFDGGEKRANIDQYVKRCEGNAINLHIYRLGYYSKCTDCEYQTKCKSSAFTAGEQAEL